VTTENSSKTCAACKDGAALPFSFSMAFQPIVDVEAKRVYAYEALVRGTAGESAYSILSQVTEESRYAFDQQCRVKAITLAVQLGLARDGAKLSINFMPGAVYSPAACLRLTLATARETGFPLDALIFEITEAEEVKDREHLVAIAREYRKHGFMVAIDDFGAGYAGFNLLAEIDPGLVKLDMDLIRGIERRPAALAIVESMVALCQRLGVSLIAEGVETVEEFAVLRTCGIHLMQGYLLAKPAFECLPEFFLPEAENGAVESGVDTPAEEDQQPLFHILTDTLEAALDQARDVFRANEAQPEGSVAA
jgi:EAL domain-containing protein (putative c-di-GMP-specific phosphodiesterase class I)